MIGQILKITVFKIQHGGNRHLEFYQQCISNVIDMFQIEVPTFPLLLVAIGQTLKKWQQFCNIQDGSPSKLHFRLNHHHEK